MRPISISELSTLRWSFFQDVVRYAAAGFESIGVWRQKIDDIDVLEATDLLHEMQMNVSSVHWAGGFTGGDGISFDDAIDDAIEAIQLTSRLGGDCLIVHPGCNNGHTRRHARRLFVGALQELVPVARDFGVKLAIEPMPGGCASAWTFQHDLQCSLTLLDEFSVDDLGLVLDLYHVGLNQHVYDRLSSLAPRISLVQLSDRAQAWSLQEKRMLLGTGIVPIEKWIRRLHELHYNGSFEIELHGSGVADVEYSALLTNSRDFLAEIPAECFHRHDTQDVSLHRRLHP